MPLIIRLTPFAIEVLNSLRAAGWAENTGRIDFVGRTFQTAVGPRAASVWSQQDRETGGYWIHGEYQSEGLNALAACTIEIKAGATRAEIDEATARWTAEALATISDTYAMRLTRT